MLTERILGLLRQAGEQPLSGETMSRTLGVSRAAVWKGVEALRSTGYVVSSAPRRGYRLESGPDRITVAELSPQLEGCRFGRSLLCLDTIDSTNSEVRRQAAQGAKEGLVILAEEQSQGRGRRGNVFHSPAGKGLYLSVLLRPNTTLSELNSLTARTAVSICRAIESCCDAKPGIKWTNDLLLHGKKLCGILTELDFEAESGALSSVVVGVGINVSQATDEFGPDLEQIATSLSVEGYPVSRTILAAAVLRELDKMYSDFPEGAAFYYQQYRHRCVTLGREVLLHRVSGTTRAFAEDLDREFALVVRYENGASETITAGEVSVRGLLGYG